MQLYSCMVTGGKLAKSAKSVYCTDLILLTNNCAYFSEY